MPSNYPFYLLILLQFLLWTMGNAQSADWLQLDENATLEEKLTLRDTVQQRWEAIDSPWARWQESQAYHQWAITSGDSLFIAHSLGQLALLQAVLSDTIKYRLQGPMVRSKTIHENLYLPENIHHLFRYTQAQPNPYFTEYAELRSRRGVHLAEIPTTDQLDLYPALRIYKDETGDKTLAEVAAHPNWLGINETIKAYDPTAVYWAKLKLRGPEQGVDSCLLLVENSEGFHAWEHITAYLVRGDESVEEQHSGLAVPKAEKPFNRYNNVLRIHLVTNEEATLYLRLSPTSGRRQPAYIGCRATRQFPTLANDTYKATGRFDYRSGFTPFAGAKMEIQSLFLDSSNELSTEYIATNWPNLAHQYTYDVAVQPDVAYWVKIRLLGSPHFTGQHLLHVSPYPFVGTDVFAFDYYDAYIFQEGQLLAHHQTGGRVVKAKRAYPFWANFIAVDVQPADTVDVFLRMSGAHESYDLSRFNFWHIDPKTVFPSQLQNATYNYFYFGAMAVQCLFFLILFFIERERIHLHFAILILGIFLGTAFVDDNYRHFVLFPGWRPLHIPLFFTALYLVQFGFIKFSESYFGYQQSSIWSRYVIPIFLLLSAGISLNTILKFDYLVPPYYPVGEVYHISAIVALATGIVFSFLLGVFDRKSPKVLKYFFFLAFSPGLIMILLLITRSLLGGFTATIHLVELVPSLVGGYQALRFTILIMLLLLALSMGYRTNLLKATRQQALQENVRTQRIHIEQLQKTDQLQELVQLKTRFYNNITHEFRTPLTVILGMTEQADHPQAIPLIRRNGKRLLQLINQLLDLSKLDSGVVQANYQLVEMVSYTQYIGESFQSLAEQKYLRLMIYSEIQQLWMDMDEERYRQIISNLLTNAIKFTPESGKVILHLSKQGEELLIKVKDNGIGINEAALAHIFDRFYQVDQEEKPEGEGTGIGLSLTKELVALLNGSIMVNSKVKKGTTFELRFPIQQTASKKLEQYEPLTTAESLATIVDTAKTLTTDLPKLLLIEDNTDVVVYIQSLLHQHYDLMIAPNGEVGIERALAEVPDIIITDVMMPRKNGFEVVQTLKRDERTSHIPIVMLTAKATQEDRLQGLQYGADAYLMKPFDKKELFVRLEKLVELRQALHARYAQAAQPILTYLSPTEEPEKATSVDDLFLQKIRQIIDEKLGDTDLDIPYLCTAMGLSTTQLFRKMKALTGQAPISFIRKVRLHKAKSLLETTANTISEIAYDLGFTDPNYFSRAFKKEFGKSPREIRF